MPYDKGDFTQQGINGHVSAVVRLNEKRLVNIDLTSNENAQGCTITGTVTDMLNNIVYDLTPPAADSLELLTTQTLGAISTTSTSGEDTGFDASIPNVSDYELILIMIENNSPSEGHHVVTYQAIWRYVTANTDFLGLNNRLYNVYLTNGALKTSAGSTSVVGVYVNSPAVSSGTITGNIYAKYTALTTGTIDGNYTLKAYGIKLLELLTII